MSRKGKKFKTGHFLKQEKKYSEHCCVPLCTASSKFNGVLSFHGFPTQPDQRRQWLVNICRDNFTVSSHTKVCSRHFTSDQVKEPTALEGRRRLVKGAVPTLFEWNGYTVETPRRSVRERVDRPIEAARPQEEEELVDVPKDPDFCTVPEPAAMDMSASAAEDLSQEVDELRKEVPLQELRVQREFGVQRFAGSDADFRFSNRRGDSTSGHHCCVPQCTASARFNSFLSFHTFPKDEELQRSWMVKIRRNNFKITNHTRVCSRHFLSTDLVEPPTPGGRRRLNHGAVPALFQWNNFTLPAPRPGVWHRTERPDTDTDTIKIEDPPMNVHYPDHDYCSSSEPAVPDLALDSTEDLRAVIARLRKQMEKMAMSNKFGLERFAASDDDIRFYTRFASHAHLMAFWRQIEPATHKMVRVTRAWTAAQTGVPHTASETSLQPIDEFFLFMTYLSLGLMQKDLAHRFKIHQSAVSRIINTWANFLYTVLGAVGIWLSEETVKAHLPDVFQNYSDTQVVLDCTELRCPTPNSLLLQREVFSTYKSHCTFKGLIGMAPHGAITFVSSLYEGSVSGKEILRQSGIVSLLKPTMAIMVDKGFLVEDCVLCKVHKPAFLSKRAQPSGSEVKETQSIARLRVHVEKLIQRVKEHKIFSTVIPLSLTGSINQLHTVACLLVNYQNGLLVKA